MEMDSNSGQAQVDSGGSSTESLSLSGGLMFGEKIYFEDGGGSGSGSGKRVRGSGSGQIPRCQVEGCRMDLSNAKGYYSRHRVCGMHFKSPKVIVGGLEQRFCQQCSRFHLLPEFDLEKRSCRRRLAGHNERRRKPQPASLLASRYGRIAPSHYGNVEPVMSGSFLGDQQMGLSSGRTLDLRVMRRPVSASSWQINSETHHHQPLNVFSQGTVTGDMMNPNKVDSYKGMAESSCALSLLSNPHQSQNNNTWRSSSSFDPMTVTLAQPSPAHNQHQYLNPAWVYKTGETSSPHGLSPVLGLGQISDSTMDGFELSHRREYMEAENTRTYDSSSSSQHVNWSL